jgi:hypothetical protein
VILLWGLDADAPLRDVRSALESWGAPVVFADQARILSTRGELHLGPGREVDGWLEVSNQRHVLTSVTSMYVRPYDFRQFPFMADLAKDGEGWRHAQQIEHLLWSVAEMTDAVVVNRPSAMQSNGSKPWQTRLIRSHGFAVPDTLLTTDAEALRWFLDRHGRVIFKSISGERSIVSELGAGDDERMEYLRWCPTQFQEHIEGQEVRVHVVGQRTFAARIESTLVDYRYGSPVIEPYDLPDHVASRCTALTRRLGLVVAGMDLRLAAADRWYCFEVNPSPAFSCYEVGSDSIGGAVAGLLADTSGSAPCGIDDVYGWSADRTLAPGIRQRDPGPGSA